MKIGLLAVSLLFLTGCAHMALENAKQEMQCAFDRVLGLREEEVVIAIGVPQSIQQLGELKIYHYYQSFGQRSNGYANAYGNGVYGSGNAWEAYNMADLVFKDGIAISWKGYVQR